jgi:hypothetical protein
LSGAEKGSGVFIDSEAAHLIKSDFMPRCARISTGGLAYHILNRRVGRLALFDKPADYMAFEKILNGAHERTGMLASPTTAGNIITNYTTLTHEVGHVAQSGVLGAGYIPIHLLAQGASFIISGLTSTHSFNPLERWLHPYPSY